MDQPTTPAASPQALTWAADPLWYQDAIIYELHVKAFLDSNNDGIGDFAGLAAKLDYVQDLGVNTIWLLPFYPSPLRDDGYDIADYHGVHPDYGKLADFRQFVREAHRRGLKVITELVVNHTSDQHPWFQAARRAERGSSKRDFYVWSDTVKKYEGTRIIFTDTEISNWAWDDVARSYYWHRFFSHQPDLNFDNPKVLKAVVRVMRYWMDMGVDGMRLDAIPYLKEREGTNNENLPETHAVLKRIRAAVDAHYRNRMLLAEANQWPEDVREYFGQGDECHMAYHFPLMPRLFMAIAQEDRLPVVEIMAQTPEIPANCQWAIFLRNHDELTLEMVTDKERDYMYRMYAADPRMRVNVGIRRRLAPLMDNDRRKIELITCLLMTMPGSPILYYGDEIGMGDNIFLGDRNGVRTPMQWSPDRNGGFSRADPQRLYLPPIMDPVYGYQAVNVEAQARNPSSLLNWTRRLIQVRKSTQAFGRGSLKFLDPGNRKILAYVREYEAEAVLCVANLSRNPQAVELDLSRFEGRVPVEQTGNISFPPVGRLPYLLTLPAYGFLSFALSADAPVPQWHEEKLPHKELPVLVLLEGFRTFFQQAGGAREVHRLMASRTREQLQREVLLPYMSTKRWFAAKGHDVRRIELAEEGEWTTDDGSWLLAFLDVECEDIPLQQYFLPLAVAWEAKGYDPIHDFGAWTLAKVRQKEKMGILYGAFGDPAFCRALAKAMGEGREVHFNHGRLKFTSTRAFAEHSASIAETVHHPSMDQSNTGVFFGTKLYLKGYRRLQVGVNPELEVGRFLTDASPFPNIAPVLGAVEYLSADGRVITLALLQQFIENQGSFWSHTQDYLERLTHGIFAGAETPASPEQATENPHGYYEELATTLGRRVGEMHRAFARVTGDPAFDPEPVTDADVDAWTARVKADVVATLDALEQRHAALDESASEPAHALLAARIELIDWIDRIDLKGIEAAKTRYHGDLHLGQVLLKANDFIIIDFEGEPARPLEERRAKHSALRDVAGMLRSFDYAAATALKARAHQPPEKAAQLAEAIGEWKRSATAAFLDGYGKAAGDCASLPRDAADRNRLLNLFLLEKALYELRYELDNRPQWLVIPIRGLLDLLQTKD
ncbi:MAG TPA: maltose alpha-D-glucosyltransferase [Pelomicrobium sp.]|nr:maltose alpha-D-glucosyltransferase [Pelomicrobium sp.]